MIVDRRNFLMAGVALAATINAPRNALAEFEPKANMPWRKFQVTTRIEIATDERRGQAWVPLPSVNEADWFRSGANHWVTNGKATAMTDRKSGARLLHVEWTDVKEPHLVEVASTIQTRDRAKSTSGPIDTRPPALTDHQRRRYTSATELIPVNGIVKRTSDEIVGRATDDLDKVRAIYEWVVVNTARDSKVRGCGVGDIASMLESGILTGKCADINALFVGLVRAQGIPARDIYGIRVAPSKFGYKSLGTSMDSITRAQHCRAEVYLTHYGWLACDPADVRKVILEEPPTNLTLDNPKVAAARKGLLGGWEGNWLAYNFANDVELPNSNNEKVAFLMYPQAECGGTRLDCLDADNFKYTIKSKEMTL